jgi:hypothetical protein
VNFWDNPTGLDHRVLFNEGLTVLVKIRSARLLNNIKRFIFVQDFNHRSSFRISLATSTKYSIAINFCLIVLASGRLCQSSTRRRSSLYIGLIDNRGVIHLNSTYSLRTSTGKDGTDLLGIMLIVQHLT